MVVSEDLEDSTSIRDASINPLIKTPKKKKNFIPFSAFASACIAGNFGFGPGSGIIAGLLVSGRVGLRRFWFGLSGVCVAGFRPRSSFYKFQKKKQKHHTRSTTNTLIPLPHTRYSPCCLSTTQRSKLNFKKNQKKTPPVSRPPHSLNPPSSNVSGHSSDFSPQTTTKKKDQLNVSHFFKQSGVGGASLRIESVLLLQTKRDN